MSLPKIHPNYYAVIPASVRYDKELPAAARLLYGELAALSNQEGFCWASNRYFANLYGATTRSVQNWLNDLEARGYIKTQYSDSASGTARNIYLTEAHEKNVMGGMKNNSPPTENNFTHNTKTNTKKNTDTSPDEAADSATTTDVRFIYELYLRCFKVEDWQEGTKLTPEQLSKAEKRYRLTDGRRAAIRRRLKDAGTKMLAAAIVGYSREPWYKGDNDREWTADLEKFICRSYEKVEEGANKYEAQSKAKNTNDPWQS